MRSRALLLVLAASLLGVPFARADSWGPYGRRVFTDPTGRYYVVATSINYGIKGVRFSFVRAKDGAPPMKPSVKNDYTEPKGTGIRAGDTVIAEGELETAPMEMAVSSKGTGFAAMEEYGGVGGGNSFVWVTSTGKTKIVHRLADLFSRGEILTFPKTVSSTWWFRTAWLDEERGHVVVVGSRKGGLVKTVALEDGAVRAGGEAEIRRAIGTPALGAQTVAIDLAMERKVTGLEDAMRALVTDSKAATAARLRAAVLLARAGDRSGAGLVQSVALSNPSDDEQAVEDMQYAVAHLGELAGEAALPVLRRLMRGEAGKAWIAAQEAFVQLGASAVPTLITMLEEVGESPDYRGGAAHALREIGSDRAVPALLGAVGNKSEYVANAALNAVIKIAGAGVSKELAAYLDKKTTQDGRLASYFRKVREPTAVAPLVRALARHPKDRYPRGTILKALKFQTGKDLGKSTAAWVKWLEAR